MRHFKNSITNNGFIIIHDGLFTDRIVYITLNNGQNIKTHRRNDAYSIIRKENQITIVWRVYIR